MQKAPFHDACLHLPPGVLPELDALGALLEANQQWLRDAAGVRARMLAVLGEVAERYVSTGDAAWPVSHHPWPNQDCLCRPSSVVKRMPASLLRADTALHALHWQLKVQGGHVNS